MKNIFKVAAIAVVAMSLAVACKSNKSEEPIDSIDTTVEAIVEDTVDSVEEMAEDVVAEEPTKPAVKKTTKKDEPVQAVDVNKVTPNTSAASARADKEAKAAQKIDAQEVNPTKVDPTKVDPKASRRR